VSSGTGRSTGRGETVADADSVAALLAEAGALGLAALDAQLLLARASGLARAMLLAHGERLVAANAATQFRAECLRRAAGEPLAYIEGRKEFWSLDLTLTPDVLVPRPETELLVELALHLLPAGPQRVADLGTGSGAIALALAHERPQWGITAVDVSAAALAVASGNAARLGLGRVRFLEGSWCEPLGAEFFDAIVSNPPYVAAADPALAALRHEPQSALAAGDEGYADLLAIAAAAREHLRPGGLLLLEHGATQAPRLTSALVALGYARVVCHPDLAGLARVTETHWPGTVSQTTE
jgi:release factor glutamine methyltransferase